MATSERNYAYDLSPDLEPIPGHTTARPAQRQATRQPTRPRIDAPRPYVAPIDRRSADKAKPAFYLLVAMAFFALSLVSTVSQVGVILRHGNVTLVDWQYIAAGLIIAAIITAGELLTGEGMVYFCFLIPDVILTVWWLWPVLTSWAISLGAPTWTAAIAGGVVGVFSAWLPERVVMGRRRKQV